ncbi:MAG: hypothetical protein EA360_05720 [Balneolaceae bacterium]|nr:MAG: hypothetical protein EA360_05720 [Balneolaceae bacterium]
MCGNQCGKKWFKGIFATLHGENVKVAESGGKSFILPLIGFERREGFAQEVRLGLKGGATFYHTVVQVDGVE